MSAGEFCVVGGDHHWAENRLKGFKWLQSKQK